MHQLCLIEHVRRVFTLLLMTACASVGGVQTADTVGKGNLQIGVEPGIQLVGGKPGLQIYPHFDAAVRFGITDKFDLGLRAGWSFLEVQAKYMLTEPDRSKVTVSVAPALGGVVLTSGPASLSGILSAATPVLIGIPVGVHQLVLGPRSQHFIFIGGMYEKPVYLLAVGGSLGFAIRFSDTLTLLPELAAVWPIFGGLPVTMSNGTQVDYLYGAMGAGVFQFKLGFLLDRRTGLSKSPL